MFYIETIKGLYKSINDNPNMPNEEKERALKLLDELTNILLFY